VDAVRADEQVPGGTRPVSEGGGDRAVLADVGGGDTLAEMDGDAVVRCLGAQQPGQRGTGDAARAGMVMAERRIGQQGTVGIEQPEPGRREGCAED
jgi:hypothetical protein